MARETSQTDPRREDLLRMACKQGELAGCDELAGLLVARGELRQGRGLEDRGCELRHPPACYRVAERIRSSEPGRAVDLYGVACLQGAADEPVVRVACLAGHQLAQQQGLRAQARALAKRTCELDPSAGLCPPSPDTRVAVATPGPSAPPKEAPSPGEAPPHSVADANLTMGSVTADGVTLDDFACRMEDAGLAALLLGPTQAGLVAKQKARMDACSPKGQTPVRVRFEAKSGKITKTEALAEPAAVARCVEKTLTNTPSAISGACSFAVLVGRKP